MAVCVFEYQQTANAFARLMGWNYVPSKNWDAFELWAETTLPKVANRLTGAEGHFAKTLLDMKYELSMKYAGAQFEMNIRGTANV